MNDVKLQQNQTHSFTWHFAVLWMNCRLV